MNNSVNQSKPVCSSAKARRKRKRKLKYIAEKAIKIKLSPKEELALVYTDLRDYLEFQRDKIIARDATYGLVTIKCVKRNIYLTLSDNQGRIKASMSTGYLKAKGRARRAAFFIKILAKRFTDLILESKLKKIHYSLCGYIPRRTKRIFLRSFKMQKKKFKIYKFTRLLKNPHNGCRPSKMRRK
jgi:ribosomal protein S11